MGGGADQWRYWGTGRETVRLLQERDHWGRMTAQVLVPSQGAVIRVPATDLAELHQRPWASAEVAWRASACRALHLLSRGEPVAVGAFDIEVLPHQMAVLDRALELEAVRLLLADEVGLGKTIEAGLIYSELQARGRVRRVLVVAPKGVQLQWVAEMQQRFGVDFARVGPEGIPVDAGVDPWRAFDRVVCSLDAVKPLRRRSGWSAERVQEHNRRRYRAMVEAGWDIVIFDEAHHVAGSSEEVARHVLARELAAVAPHVLLLSATPHSGKTEAFARLLGLLDSRFTSGLPISRDKVAPLVVRTEKRDAVDSSGKPLFQPRTTTLEVVLYGERSLEQALYDAVSDYVRLGYDRARREKRPAAGFLLLLMQRLVSSSTSAILSALERRAAVLGAVGEQLALFAERAEQWGELSGEEQYDALLEARGAAWGDESAEVDLLLDLARKAAANGIDAKASYLLALLRRLQREERDPSAKVLIFTEFVQTQEMLLELLDDAGIAATGINGSMSMEERAIAQEEFREHAQVLVSTDAGGEGINLQFAHLVVNYDLPWNPMRIEQRIGRVDRIGQLEPVRAFNLVLENSVDQRVLEVLERKLWIILRELGTDKWGDVLETAAGGVEELYAEAIANPEELEDEVRALAARTTEEIDSTESLREMLSSKRPRAKSRSTEFADELVRAAQAFERWNGEPIDEPSDLLERLPQIAPGESLPTVSGFEDGLWSLWEVTPADASRRDCFSVFTSDTGAVRPDLAERIWMALCKQAPITIDLPLTETEWGLLQRTGIDHGYGPCAALAEPDRWTTPWLSLRLAVRVTR